MKALVARSRAHLPSHIVAPRRYHSHMTRGRAMPTRDDVSGGYERSSSIHPSIFLAHESARCRGKCAPTPRQPRCNSASRDREIAAVNFSRRRVTWTCERAVRTPFIFTLFFFFPFLSIARVAREPRLYRATIVC